MKRTMKKFIAVLLIILSLFHFTYSNYMPVYCAEDDTTLLNKGLKTFQTVTETVTNIMGGIVGILLWLPKLGLVASVMGLQSLMGMVVYVDGATEGNVENFLVTPFEIFFNKVQILDINFLDVNPSNPKAKNTTSIRTQVAKWYYVVRLLAISILLLILLYVGIRMAISSVASEKAIYKKSLVDWSVSLVLVFVLQYIIMFTVQANNAIINALEILATEKENPLGMSTAIMDILELSMGVGWSSFAAVAIYIIIVVQTFIFFLKYVKRMLTIGFLIIISPLISITYSIDKMGDGKAQALNNWLKEFVYGVLIQPFHCIMYLAFVNVAIGLLGDTGIKDVFGVGGNGNQLAGAILAIVCLTFIDTGENLVKKIFGLESDTAGSLKMAAGMAAGVSLAKSAPKMAQNARKGINFAKNNVSKAGNALAVRNMQRKNPSMTRSEAQSAVDQQREQKQLEKRGKKTVKSINKKKNAKVEERMKENLNLSDEAFDELKDKAKKGDKKALGTINGAFNTANKELKVEKQMKKDLMAEGHTAESAEKWMKERKGSDEYNQREKIATNKVDQRRRDINGVKKLAGTFTRATGGVMFSSLLACASMGANQWGAVPGLFSMANTMVRDGHNSKEGTIAKEVSAQCQSVGCKNETETNTLINQAIVEGDQKKLEPNSKESKDIKTELEQVLMAMGLESKLEQILASIEKEKRQDPQNFDLNSVLQRTVGPQHAENETLQEKAQAFADHTSKVIIYEEVQKNRTFAGDDDRLRDMAVENVDYMANAQQNSTPEQIDVNQVVTHVQDARNVETIINRIDQADVELAIRKIDEKLAELRGIENPSEKIQAQVIKFTQARDQLSERMSQSPSEPDPSGSEGE